MKFLLVFSLIGIVFLAGCTQLTSVVKTTCEPNYVTLGTTYNLRDFTDDICKTACYREFQVTSHKLAQIDVTPLGENPKYTCFCDVNNCNP